MSNSGKFTPLQLNVIGGLQQGRGFSINAEATALQGSWLPYTLGSVVETTVLNELTQAIPTVYSNLGTTYPSTYLALIELGSTMCPALANSRPDTFIETYKGGYVASWPSGADQDVYEVADYDSYFSNGFIATIARQAHYELWSSTSSFRYNDIVKAFSQFDSWRQQQNRPIASFVNSQSFDSGLFSNINDVTTNNLSGVSQCFRIWGQDMINLGRTIDLTNIWRFGLPSVLLLTLQTNNAVTQALKLAMTYAGLTVSEIARIFTPGYVPTAEQEKQIYESFKLIQGDDLLSLTDGIVYGLNCKTQGLTSLADLLDPRKMFPNSYNSLTVPQYRTDVIQGKIYYFIYTNGGVNSVVATLPGVEERVEMLSTILPPDVAIAAAAFGVTMQQVTDITNADIEKLSLAIVDLELTNLGLPLINTATGTPVDLSIADSMLQVLALGSGNSGSYRQCDFFGAAAGYPYIDLYKNIQRLLKLLPTQRLAAIYHDINILDYTDPDVANTKLLDYIAQANAEIAAISASSTSVVDQLNYYWEALGTQMTIEQRSITTAMPSVLTATAEPTPYDFVVFGESLDAYAQDNGPGESGDILDRISDRVTVSGSSTVASLRESRNAARLAKAGTAVENNVPDTLDLCSASAKAVLTDGTITSIIITAPGSGYSDTNPPCITVYPVGYGAVLSPVVAPDGTIADLIIENGGELMPQAQITIESPPVCQPNLYSDTPEGWPPEPSYTSNQFNDEMEIDAIQPPDSASPTVEEAILDVTHCNCDCWNI